MGRLICGTNMEMLEIENFQYLQWIIRIYHVTILHH